ncbi:MAG TPA: TIGR01777 family oxidoreductase, partial [Polyangiaceae bacterium]|nr:TIGR01777 family oxidoreductase [Polyangiaceae bacterium]
MRIVVSGGTGFIASALVPRLAARGDEVLILSRSGKLPERFAQSPGLSALSWDPPAPGPWQKSIDGVDAVVHLAGEQAVGQRYSEAVKKRIVASRVGSAERLVEAIAMAERKPRAFISASGVGYYGGRLDDLPLDESAPAGSDFLADVCRQWEAAARTAEPHGVRVAIARTGVVFGRHGGALETMIKPFRLFVGGPIASGQQYFSWIHLQDMVRVYLRLLDDD